MLCCCRYPKIIFSDSNFDVVIRRWPVDAHTCVSDLAYFTASLLCKIYSNLPIVTRFVYLIYFYTSFLGTRLANKDILYKTNTLYNEILQDILLTKVINIIYNKNTIVRVYIFYCPLVPHVGCVMDFNCISVYLWKIGNVVVD